MAASRTVSNESMLPNKYWWLAILALTALDLYITVFVVPLKYAWVGIGLMIYPVFIFLLGYGMQEGGRSSLRHAS